MRSSVSILLALILIGVFEVETSAPQQVVSTPAKDDRENPATHYLMLVNTALASQLNAPKLAQFDRSPYDALAVSFADAYDTSPVLSADSMEAQLAALKKSTHKDIWPWVYVNRMIGGNDSDANKYSKVPYFQRIQGVDLDDGAVGQRDFLANWRNALRVAKDTEAPGIVCDLEFYNDYKAYDLGELARMRSRSRQELLKMLRRVGARMADLAASEYPDATLWFFFTGFTRPDYRMINSHPYFLAATYIVEGLLDEIRQRHLSLHVLTGGEVGLGYCHTSLNDLRQAIQKRATVFKPLLQGYRGILEMTGTMTLWGDRSAKRNWVAQGACGAASANTVEDLEPYMELLFRTYRYNWIYGSPNGGYLAFQPDIAPRFDAAISEAKKHAFGAEPH